MGYGIFPKWKKNRQDYYFENSQIIKHLNLNKYCLKLLFCEKIFGPVNDFQCLCGRKVTKPKKIES